MHQNAKNTNIKWKVKPDLVHFEDTEKNQGFKHPIKSEAWQSKFKKRTFWKKQKKNKDTPNKLSRVEKPYCQLFLLRLSRLSKHIGKKPFFNQKTNKDEKIIFFQFWKVFLLLLK